MNNHKIYIYSNNTDLSNSARKNLYRILEKNEFIIADLYTDDVDLIACIGGDGTFLNFLHECDFPSKPVIGINTGHLGFFQELNPEEIGEFIENYRKGRYAIQTVKPIRATVVTRKSAIELYGLNEMLIRGPYSHLTHMAIEIDGTPIQKFSGDGVLVSTPVGSTAYNYSLGGALVDPDLEILQLTPIAPMNTDAYRCFRSSIMFPAYKKVSLIPEGRTGEEKLLVSFDGQIKEYENVNLIEIVQSELEIHLIRFQNYDYWEKLKNKLL